jgi:hypothetical protein
VKTAEAATVKASEAAAMETTAVKAAAAKSAARCRVVDLGNQHEQPCDSQYENSAHLILLADDRWCEGRLGARQVAMHST